jgi:hypothetical protein
MAGVTATLRFELTLDDTDADTENTDPVVVLDKSITGITDIQPPKRFTIQNTTRTVWDASASGEEIGSFQLLVMWTNVAVEVEMTIGEGEGTEELNSFRLAPNTPFVLTADDAYRNHSASDAFAGTLDVIDKIRVKEANNVAATVYLLLAE